MYWIRFTVLIFLIAIIDLSGVTQAADTSQRMEQTHSYIPKKGFVQDEQTAIAIAEAILVPIYGKQAIEKQKPFAIKLSGDVWTVTGSLPREQLGGVFLIQISKKLPKSFASAIANSSGSASVGRVPRANQI